MSSSSEQRQHSSSMKLTSFSSPQLSTSEPIQGFFARLFGRDNDKSTTIPPYQSTTATTKTTTTTTTTAAAAMTLTSSSTTSLPCRDDRSELIGEDRKVAAGMLSSLSTSDIMSESDVLKYERHTTSASTSVHDVVIDDDNISQKRKHRQQNQKLEKDQTPSSSSAAVIPQKRTLTNVLNKLKAKDAGEVSKQYWMPDYHCKECYDCHAPFTTFRRRHHCRVCGQIFCWKCCRDEISGEVFGYKGELRVCNYCLKVVHDFSSSTNRTSSIDSVNDSPSPSSICVGTPDKDGTNTSGGANSIPDGALFQRTPSFSSLRIRTKSSRNMLWKMSSRYSISMSGTSVANQIMNRCDGSCNIDCDNCGDFRAILLHLRDPQHGLVAKDRRYRLSTYTKCYVSNELVGWLVQRCFAKTRQEGVSICQALLDSRMLYSVTGENQIFKDDYTLMRFVNDDENRLEMRGSESNGGSCGSNIEDDIGISGAYAMDRKASLKRGYSESDRRNSTQCTITTTVSDYDKRDKNDGSDVDEKDDLGPCWFEELLSDDGCCDDETRRRDRSRDYRNSRPMMISESRDKGISDDMLSSSLCDLNHPTVRRRIRRSSFADTRLTVLNGVCGMLQSTGTNSSFPRTSFVDNDVQTCVDAISLAKPDMCVPEAVSIEIDPEPTTSTDEQLIRTVSNRQHFLNFMKKLISDGSVSTVGIERKPTDMSAVHVQSTPGSAAKPPINVARKHALKLCEQLLVEEKLDAEWVQVVMPMALRASANVTPSVVDGDNADIRNYIKVKKLIGKAMDSSAYVEGIVCTKNVAHKKMRKRINRPRILMIAFAVEYQRVANQFSSLDPLLLQEREYLKILVARIALHKPDIVIVEKTVSRLAQDFIRDEGITLVLNLRSSVVENVARCTGADLLTSVEQLNLDVVLGSCLNFHVENYYNVEIGKEKTLMYFDGCRNDLGCTITLCGPSTAVLNRVKGVLIFMIYVLYNQRNEIQLMMDEGAIVRDVQPTPDNVPETLTPPAQLITWTRAARDAILCTTPDVVFPPPYIYTVSATGSTIKDWLPRNLYWSQRLPSIDDDAAFVTATATVDVPVVTAVIEDGANADTSTNVAADIVAGTAETTVPVTPFVVTSASSERGKIQEREYRWKLSPLLSLSPTRDCFSISNHQNIMVLVSSLSRNRNATIGFDPQVIKMDFYGDTDMTVGDFLESNCFNEDNKFPSALCDVHYTHYNLRLTVGVDNFQSSSEKNFVSTNSDIIYMWNWCRICHKVTPIVPMSLDTWNFSFGKYLELSFYRDDLISSSAGHCSHGLYRDHVRYFCKGKLSVHMTIDPIILNEVAVPKCILSEIISRHSGDSSCITNQPLWQSAISSLELIGDKLFKDIATRVNFLELYSRQPGTNSKAAVAHNVRDTLVDLAVRADTQRQFFLEQLKQAVRSLSSGKSCDSSYSQAVAQELYVLRRYLCVAVITWNNLLEEVRGHFLPEKIKRHPKASAMSGPCAELDVSRSLTIGTSPPKTYCGFTTELDHVNNVVSSPNAFSDGDSSSTRVSAQLSLQPLSLYEPLVEDSVIDKPVYTGTDTNRFRTLSNENTRDGSGVVPSVIDMPELASSPTGNLIKGSKHDGSMIKSLDDLYNMSEFSQKQPMSPLSTVSTEDLYDIPSDQRHLPVLSSQNGSDVSLSSSVSATALLSTVNTSEGTGTEDPAIGSRNIRSSSDKKVNNLMKTISHLLPSKEIQTLQPISSPFPAEEHYLLPLCPHGSVVVSENEPSSIIAYFLSSECYHVELDKLVRDEAGTADTCLETLGVPLSGDGGGLETPGSVTPLISPAHSVGDIASLLQRSESIDGFNTISTHAEITVGSSSTTTNHANKKNEAYARSAHICHEFNDSTAKFYCRGYFARRFADLRNSVIEGGDKSFVHSISHCLKWAACGGKSGSSFCKTFDDRYVVKQMSRLEMQSFFEFAGHYFEYMHHVVHDQRPTVLAKILGVFRIGFRNSVTNRTMKQDVLVMENLFYGRKIKQIFDLKGSRRSRYVQRSGKDNDVLMDENLLELIRTDPLFVRSHTKMVFMKAIWNDTHFLSVLDVMDYSLLIGIDEKSQELVVGIIDYIRTFTWDKKLETWVKSSGILGQYGKMPTVVSPEQYKCRFRDAMMHYISVVPDKWSRMIDVISG